MNTSEQILVIILSTALAVFLVLAIAIAVQVIQLMSMLKRVAQKAQDFVDSAEATAEMVKNAAGHLSILRFVQQVVEMATKHGASKKTK
ncbi:MAG TPA: hypothetical protein VLF91_05950 [Candidatus Saccharimonadales bacterium]|nr:hypothetical protein [Candidatus Saccharimonadales bacterium]